MRFVIAVVVAILAAREAAACPGLPCTKHLGPPRVTAYRRAGRAAPPRFDHRVLAAFLDGSTWTPGGGGPTIRFAVRAQRPLPGERVVLVRRIEQRAGATYVELDGDFYMLSACAATSCLVRAAALPPEDRRFATPP